MSTSMMWQELLSKLEVGLVIVDADYRIQVWNEFMINHSGLREDQVTGKVLFDQFNEIDKQWFTRKAEPVFRLNSPAYVIAEQRPYLFRFDSYRPVTSASDVMYQNITLLPLSSDAQQVDRIGIVVYDVTTEVMHRRQIAQANEQLEAMSRVDGLTGLFNRRYWEESCDLEFKRQERHHGDATLVMLDIDHFKAINDTYGHPAGDQVIKELASTIRRLCRETDIAGRYGGEEFAVLLPQTSINDAVVVAERIRKEVEATVVEHDGQRIQFTTSLGISSFESDFTNFMSWVEQADKALYQAKQSGRNKHCVAGQH